MNWGQAGKRDWVVIKVTGRLIDKNKRWETDTSHAVSVAKWPSCYC